jgi:hypothetical protein
VLRPLSEYNVLDPPDEAPISREYVSFSAGDVTTELEATLWVE